MKGWGCFATLAMTINEKIWYINRIEIFVNLINFILHIDVHLTEIFANYGVLAYGILFLIIFCETGLVFIPFLPGDSLLFAVGAITALGSTNIFLVFLLLWLAAFLGDNTNYWIGWFIGQKLIDHPKIPINQKHIDKTQEFYKKHGGKTIFLARFIPIVRTFAPFVAGIGKMHYKKFITFSIAGSFTWVALFVFMGYFFGNIPQIKHNFSLVIMAIIIISVMPIVIEFIKTKFSGRKSEEETKK